MGEGGKGFGLWRIQKVNTQAPSKIIDCCDHNNSKYYGVVVLVHCCFHNPYLQFSIYAMPGHLTYGHLLYFSTLFDSMLKRLKTICLHSTMGRYLKRKSIDLDRVKSIWELVSLINTYLLRLAPEETPAKLMGCEHNAVTC
ncbi:hypothetical protein POTOM_000996 [Populus tomentosa]|uniref:Uncharacterized protein n=1 Tax=Populus tomentosa TaxID=118781 RepID=A0A8X8IUV9_POPTO|nr:hypothetical protein POTOM_000996 [Populus tomentosa]